MSTTPDGEVKLARLPRRDRLHAAAKFRGCIVTMGIGREVDGRTTRTDQLDAVAVAEPADVAILHALPGRYPRALSLATIATIRLATMDERTALEAEREALR